MSDVPSVLLVGGAELDACAAVLTSVGSDFLRVPTLQDGAAIPLDWPRDLLITTPDTAELLQTSGSLSPDSAALGACVWVCLHDESLPAFRRRQLLDAGVNYLARGWQNGRPDRTLLRLLVLQLLYEGAERRGAARLICRHPLEYVIGTGRRKGRLMDLSRTGCRFISEQALSPGTELEIYLPSDLDPEAPTAFAAVTVRCSIPSRGPDGQANASVVARFEDLPARQLAQLDAALDVTAKRGPVFEQHKPVSDELVLTEQDRRDHPRHDCEDQIVALTLLDDEERYVVRGRDLSMHGMRLAAHPSLPVGSLIELRLHSTDDREPLVLSARVRHETEPDGDLGVSFEATTPDQLRELERLLDHLPRLELLCSGTSEPESQILCGVRFRDG